MMKKVDSPSGTSKEFAEEMAEAFGKDITEITHHAYNFGGYRYLEYHLCLCKNKRRTKYGRGKKEG